MNTLLIEDDPAIAEALTDGLPRYGFTVSHVTTVAEAMTSHVGAAIILLDLTLPDGDGIDVCRALREISDVPIIIITARADEVERVVGLELGADDYLTKPFGLRELVARMRAVLRRTTTASGSGPTAVAAADAEPEVAQPPQVVGQLRLDRDGRRAYVAGAEVGLTPKEFDLLSMLASRPSVVVSREDLMQEVWDEHWFGSTRTLDVHVGALRRKLAGAVDVQTVRGVGFRLEPVE